MNPVERTKELVAINSVNPFLTYNIDGKDCGVGNENNICEYLESALIQAGFRVSQQEVQGERKFVYGQETRIIPRRYNIIAEKGTGDSSLLFFGHTDTVDVKEGWKTNPFSAAEKIVGGRRRLYGLGANDMKAGLAAILHAGEAIPKGFKLKVAFLADEEFWSFGAVELLRSDFLDDVKLAIVPEISESNTEDGNLWVGLGRLGRSEFEFQLEGFSCHGADAFVHPKAVNAVHESIKLQTEVIHYCNNSRREFRDKNIRVANSAYISRHEGGRAILSVPEHASFILDRSFLPNETPSAELESLERLVAECYSKTRVDPGVKITLRERFRPTPPCKPYYFSRDLPAVSLLESLARNNSIGLEFGIGRSVADENRIAEKGIVTLILGPQGDGSHTSEEWVDVESILSLASLLKDLANSNGTANILRQCTKV